MSAVTTHTVLRCHAAPAGQRQQADLMQFRRATGRPSGDHATSATTLFFSTQG